MLLTDNLEVFVANLNEPVYHLSEFSNHKNHPGSTESHYVGAVAGEHYHGITVVFGTNFNIVPKTSDPQYRQRVKACRLKITIDEGIAVEERILKLPDVVNIENDEKIPAVQRIDVFSTASLSWDGKLERCRFMIQTVPEIQPDDQGVPNRVKMPQGLQQKLGHIDIEFERGYLDYSREDQAFPFVPHIPDAFEPTYYVTSVADLVYRAKLVPFSGKQLRDTSGFFVAAEETKHMRIDYLCRSQIACGLNAQYITRRERTPKFSEMLAAADDFYQHRRVPKNGANAVASSMPIKLVRKDSKTQKRKTAFIDLTQHTGAGLNSTPVKKKARREDRAGCYRARTEPIDFTDDAVTAQLTATPSKRAKSRPIDLTGDSVRIRAERVKLKEAAKSQARPNPQESKTGTPTSNSKIGTGRGFDWTQSSSDLHRALPKSANKSNERRKPMPRPIMSEKMRQRALNATESAGSPLHIKQRKPDATICRKSEQARGPTRHDSVEPDPSMTNVDDTEEQSKANNLLKQRMRDAKAARSALPSPQSQDIITADSTTLILQEPMPAALPDAELSPSTRLFATRLPQPHSSSLSIFEQLEATVRDSSSQSSSTSPSPPPLNRYGQLEARNKRLDSLPPVDQSTHLSDIGRTSDRKAVLDPSKIHLLGTGELHVLKAKFDYMAARKEARGSGNGEKALRIKIAGLQCTQELCKRELRALHAELDEREEL